MSEPQARHSRQPGNFIGKAVFVIGFVVVLTILGLIHFFASR
jgi:uncharacterized membrane protein